MSEPASDWALSCYVVVVVVVSVVCFPSTRQPKNNHLRKADVSIESYISPPSTGGLRYCFVRPEEEEKREKTNKQPVFVPFFIVESFCH